MKGRNMKTFAALILLGQGILALSPGHRASPRQGSGDALQVSTTSGQVHGKIDPSLPNVRQFLGIPYARPPTGDRRWAPPELLDDPDAQISAVELPPSCMQSLSTSSPSVYNRDVLEFNLQGLNRTGAISEDCLTASVWAPTNGKSGLPVLIYVYGGGFHTGGQDVPYQIPAQWVNRTRNHIVVSFNYRLNIFGFPNAAGLESQNLGLLDQRAFVQWCEKNIAAFGGDPSRMVLWGQSAGSISVDMYNFAYPDDPVVGGFIMDSGTAESGLTSADTPHSNFTFVAENVGCGGLGEDPAKELDCMRGVDAIKIKDFVASYAESGSSPSLSFYPVPDETVVFSNYTQRALQDQQAQIVHTPPLPTWSLTSADHCNSQPSSAQTPKTVSPSPHTTRADPTRPLPSKPAWPPSSVQLPRPLASASRQDARRSVTSTPAISQTSRHSPGSAHSTQPSCRCSWARMETSAAGAPRWRKRRVALFRMHTWLLQATRPVGCRPRTGMFMRTWEAPM